MNLFTLLIFVLIKATLENAEDVLVNTKQKAVGQKSFNASTVKRSKKLPPKLMKQLIMEQNQIQEVSTTARKKNNQALSVHKVPSSHPP